MTSNWLSRESTSLVPAPGQAVCTSRIVVGRWKDRKIWCAGSLTTTTPPRPAGLKSSRCPGSRSISTTPAPRTQRRGSGPVTGGVRWARRAAVSLTGQAQSSQLWTSSSGAPGRSKLDSATARHRADVMSHAPLDCGDDDVKHQSIQLFQAGKQQGRCGSFSGPGATQLRQPFLLGFWRQPLHETGEGLELGCDRGGSGGSDVPLRDQDKACLVVLQGSPQSPVVVQLGRIVDAEMSLEEFPSPPEVRKRILRHDLADLVFTRADPVAVSLLACFFPGSVA